MTSSELAANRSRILTSYAVTGAVLSSTGYLMKFRIPLADAPIATTLIFVGALSAFVWAGTVSASAVHHPGERADPSYQMGPILDEFPLGLIEIGALLLIKYGLLEVPAPGPIVVPPGLYTWSARKGLLLREGSTTLGIHRGSHR